MSWQVQAVDAGDPDLHAAIVRPMGEAGTRTQFAFSPHYKTFALFGPEGPEGGLIAQIYWDWMTIDVLAVPERWREEGAGRALMEAAEMAACEAGCRGLWASTYSFQSPGFYEALGFQIFGRLPHYPEGEERLFFAKYLTSDARQCAKDRTT